ncbi:MAG: pseudouridine synthase [Pseudomonadota bacterium]|nr:pseudouridine synthase [Pseudomonadota bacterium]
MLIDILYQDDDMLAVHKPAKCLVHPSQIATQEQELTLVERLESQLQQKVFPVHRLDRPTSGVLLFALKASIAPLLQQQFQAEADDERVKKHYLAVVRGFAPEQQVIDHPAKPIRDKRLSASQNAPKPAQTHLSCRAKYELPFSVDRYPSSRYSLVELQPLTGRKHQLRYHMKHIARPIIGDPRYGKRLHNQLFCDRLESSRLLLKAQQLELMHPVHDERLIISANKDDFDLVVERLDRLYQVSV